MIHSFTSKHVRKARSGSINNLVGDWSSFKNIITMWSVNSLKILDLIFLINMNLCDVYWIKVILKCKSSSQYMITCQLMTVDNPLMELRRWAHIKNNKQTKWINAYLYSLLCSISLCVMSLTVNKRLCRDKLPANAKKHPEVMFGSHRQR